MISVRTGEAHRSGGAGRRGRSAAPDLRRRLGRYTAGMVVAAVLAGAAPPAPAGSIPAPEPVSAGSWGPVEDWPLIAIHAALDRDGRVVTYGTDAGGVQTGRFVYDRWTPGPSAAAGHQTLPNTTTTDLFCSLQLNRVDTGDMLLFGGDNWAGWGATNTGNPDINSLDPDSGELVALPGLQRPRWYATGSTLPDGSIYIQGGDQGWDRPERWSPERGAEVLPLDTSPYDWWYPRNFVLADGRIFGVDIKGQMYFVSPDLRTITPAGRLPADRRGQGATAVMFRPGKILHFGGSTDTAVIIDVTGNAPVVTPTAAASSARRWVNGTLLPDGRVLATGGATIEGTGTATDIGPYTPNLAAEVWDPRTGHWTVQASGAEARLYHSTALLLPDGRVLVAGGGAPGPVTNTDAEIFSPDYLVGANGAPAVRPTITAVSSTDVVPGATLAIDVASATSVDRVTMIKTGSVTHSFNMEQRLVELPFRADGARLTATVPLNEAHVTPGWYLLSVLDDAGIPSESRIVRVASPTAAEPVAGVDGQVVRLYQGYFLRPPDDDGYRYWRRARLAGTTLGQVSDQFAASAEFVNRYGQLDDDGFVERVYANVLGREPDDEGRAYWRDQLTAGVGRGAVMMAFSESPEFIALTGTPAPDATAPVVGAPVTPASPLAAPVARLYLGYFSRPADESGLAYWVDQRQRGVGLAAVSASFASSPEFELRYGGTDDAQFVDLVYHHVMGRGPDAAGSAYWTRQLRRGLSRGGLMVQFTESPEFAIRSAPLA